MMRTSFIPRNFIQRSALLAALITISAGQARSQGAEALNLKVGQSVVIDYPSDIRQVDFSNPEILDGNAVTTREIVLHGKGLGTTTMIVWSKSGQRTFYNITVDTNIDPLKRLLRESFPNENIQVSTSRDSISLNGHVSNKEVVDRAVALATRGPGTRGPGPGTRGCREGRPGSRWPRPVGRTRHTGTARPASVTRLSQQCGGLPHRGDPGVENDAQASARRKYSALCGCPESARILTRAADVRVVLPRGHILLIVR